MKDPAFLFYSSDFITGTYFMTDEQVGKYIRLMCMQHQKEKLTEKDMLKICKTYDEDIYSKFIQDENGNYYNKRLLEEIEKRRAYSESRRKNRQKKEKREENKEDMINISNTYDKHMENENEIENINININDNRNKKYEKIIEIYNMYCVNLPQVQKLTNKRKTAINKLLNEINTEQFEQICIIANKSDFLIGNNDRGWKADFDFLIKPDKAVSILEGKYNNKNQKGSFNDFIDMWKEAKDEEERNNTNNNTFGW
jgi:uncharacterized protein YdaU (DUF1376 family)